MIQYMKCRSLGGKVSRLRFSIVTYHVLPSCKVQIPTVRRQHLRLYCIACSRYTQALQFAREADKFSGIVNTCFIIQKYPYCVWKWNTYD
jgi:hypothetical protein